jgi:hypothetical protein
VQSASKPSRPALPQLPCSLLHALLSALLATCLANTPAPPCCFAGPSALTLAGPVLRASPAFSGRPAGRPVSATLHERAAPPPGSLAPARGPLLAATHPGPVGPDPVLSPRARGAAAGDLRPGARAATRRSASRAHGPGSGSPLLRPAVSTVLRARGPAGPAAPAAVGSLQLSLGDGRGTCPALPGPRHAGPSPWGAEGGRALLSRSLAGRSNRPPRARRAAAGVLRPRPVAPPTVRRLGRVLHYSYSPSPLCCARVVPLGPPRRLAATSAVGTGGGRVPPSRGCVRPARRRGGS